MDSYTKLLETQRTLTQITDTVRAAYIPIMNSLDIPEISLAESLAKSAQAALPKIQLIDYREGLLASTKALEEAMFQAQAIQDQQIQNLKHIISSIRFTELESLDCLADTLRQFAHVLEEAALYDDSFYLDEAEDEEDYIDEETAEILAAVVGQVQTVFEPESAVPLERLRAFFSGITWEKAKATLEAIVLIISLIQGFMPNEELQRNNELTEALIVHELEADARTHEQNEQIIELLTEMNEKLDALDPASDIGTVVVLPELTDEVSEQSCSDESHDGQQ